MWSLVGVPLGLLESGDTLSFSLSFMMLTVLKSTRSGVLLTERFSFWICLRIQVSTSGQNTSWSDPLPFSVCQIRRYSIHLTLSGMLILITWQVLCRFSGVYLLVFTLQLKSKSMSRHFQDRANNPLLIPSPRFSVC